MKCKFCDGSGKDYWCLNGVPYPCPVCNGTGEIKDEPISNEEWRRTCSAEEFADWIAHKYTTLLCMQKHFKYVDEDTCLKCSLKEKCRNEVEIPVYQMWLRWLKQPHGKE